jgi:hypothetical protein
MNYHEEELQNNIEAGRPTGADDADVKAYRKVFRALSTPPETSLPNNFADRIERYSVPSAHRPTLLCPIILPTGS